MKTIHVVAAIIKRNNEILIAQRNYGEFKNLWEFPGGKVDKNETREEALKRELLEEMNVEIHIQEHFITITYDYPNFHLIMDCFICSLNSKEISLHVHDKYRWVAIQDALIDIDWIPADIQIIHALQEKFGK